MARSPALAFARLGVLCALLLSGCSLLPSVDGPKFQSDTLVAADTWSFTALTLRPSASQALRAREVLDLMTRDSGFDQLPTPSGRVVDVERDLLSRLDGEVAVALSGSPDEPLVTVLAHTNDVDGTLRLLADDAQPPLTRDARGVTHLQSGDDERIVVGYRGWIVATNSAAARDQTLDRIDGKGSPTLANMPRYRSVVDRLAGDRLGFGYLDAAPLQPQGVRNPLVANALEGQGRLAYAFGFDESPDAGVYSLGMRMEYIPDVPQPMPAASGDALAAMDRLPKASLFAMSGSNLSAYTAVDGVPDEARAVLEQFAGPFSLGVSVAPTTRLEALSGAVNGVFVLAQLAPDGDPDVLADAIDELAAADPEANGWQHEVVISDSWLAINAVPAPASLAELPQDLLAADRLYQWTRQGFVRDGTNVFVRLDAFTSAVAGELDSTEALAALQPVRALGLSVQTEPLGESHAHLSVLISERTP